MKRCTQCGRDNMDHENFCSSCGNSLNQAPIGKVCPNCQMPVAVDDRFCDNCGTSLPETSSGGFNAVPPNVPNSTRPMAGATPPPVFNQPTQTPVNQQPIMQQPVSQQPIGQQPPMMQPGGYQQYNQVPFPGTPMPAKKNNLALILSISVVLLLAIGGGVYFFFFNKDKEVIAPPPTNQTNSESNTGTNNQTPSTNQTKTSTTNKGTEKPTPPPPKEDKPVALGFQSAYSGKIGYPLQFYQVLDFHGDGMTELVVGTAASDSTHLDVLSWNGTNFDRISFLDVPSAINEVNASAPRDGVQWLYIPTTSNLMYTLEVQDGSFIYDSVDMGMQSFSVVDGEYDQDGEADFAILTQKEDGSYIVALSPSNTADKQPMPLSSKALNMFLTDIDGDKVDDLIYIDFDADYNVNIFFAIWNGKSFEEVGSSTFGDNLINFFPGDVDHDGVSEIVTTNYTEDSSTVETLVWKWNSERLEFVLVDILAVDHPDVSFANPVVGDFTGDGSMDIMVVVTPKLAEGKDFIIYTR